jgi:hypothetical protein
MAELETERITFELQQQKAAKLARGGEGHPSEMGSSPPSVTDDDGRSMVSMQSESGIHASQMGIPPTSTPTDGPQDGGLQAQKARKSKLQLWNDLKISCMWKDIQSNGQLLIDSSYYPSLHSDLYTCTSDPSNSDSTESPWTPKLSFECSITCIWWNGTVNY